MKPVTRLSEVIPGLYRWSSFHPQWRIDFSSYALQTSAGVLFFDPLRPGPSLRQKLAALGEPIGVCLTNANHDRDADWFRKEFDIQIYAHESAKADCDTTIDVLVLDGENLPGGVRAIRLPGASAGSVGYYARTDGGVLLLGDALTNLPTKGLTLLPEQYLEDRRQLPQSLKKLLALEFQCVTFAHGEPLVTGAKKQIANFLKKLRKKTS